MSDDERDEKCRSCMFYQAGDTIERGECRYSAPTGTVGIGGSWPKVLPTDWCRRFDAPCCEECGWPMNSCHGETCSRARLSPVEPKPHD